MLKMEMGFRIRIIGRNMRSPTKSVTMDPCPCGLPITLTIAHIVLKYIYLRYLAL